jgi:hypothetical protein
MRHGVGLPRIDMGNFKLFVNWHFKGHNISLIQLALAQFFMGTNFLSYSITRNIPLGFATPFNTRRRNQ